MMCSKLHRIIYFKQGCSSLSLSLQLVDVEWVTACQVGSVAWEGMMSNE